MTEIAESFGHTLKEKRLVVSDKTVIIAPAPKLCQAVVGLFQAQGIPAKPARTGLDLGLGTTAGRFRSEKKVQQRRSKARCRFSRILRMRRLAGLWRVTQGAWRTG
eukprot:7307736-Pyramimonas_sp.AAC.1